jgi:DnaJ-class molecular chaperone
MAIPEEHIAELKHAYQVLGVPLSATSASIKQSYRQLVKRWHPDLYKSGTEEYAEATQMTKLINEAYALIGDAPLRFYVDAFPTAYAAARQAARPAPEAQRTKQSQEYPKVESIFKFSWLEFWIRFVLGAFFGAMLGFGGIARRYVFDAPSMSAFAFVIVASAIVVGLAAACAGDEFWHTAFGRWWMWW